MAETEKRRLDAIFFDIDDTLYSTTKFSELARRRAIRNMIEVGLQISEDEAYEELLEVIAEFSSNHDDHFGKLISRIPKEKYAHTYPPLLIAAAVAGYHDTKQNELLPFLEAKKLLAKLYYETKLSIGVITAGLTIKQASKMWRLGIWHYFNQDAIFISDDVGISKPNPKIYQKACDSIGVNPKFAMYIGDNAPHDIDPAVSIGMNTILVKTRGKYNDTKGFSNSSYIVHNHNEIWGILDRDFDFPRKT